MRLLIRGAFVLAIAAGVSLQAIQIKRGAQIQSTTTTVSVAATRLGLTAVNSGADSLIALTSPDCSDRIDIQSLNLDGRSGAEPPGSRTTQTSDRYIFLGSVNDHPRIFWLRGRWLLASLLYVVGLRPDKPGNDILHVTFPTSCSHLTTVDWAQLSPW
jgi:hypothetical protein